MYDGYRYKMDVVFCVEATSNMKPFATQLSDLMISLLIRIADSMKAHGRSIRQLRVKLIVFRDFSCCPEPIVESKFFVLPEEEEALNNFIRSIDYQGGYGFCNALEAIELAIQSDWITAKGYSRQIICIFTNGKVRPLGGYQRFSSKYPADMPADLAELDKRWSRYVGDGHRVLGGFVPHAEPWIALETWDGYIPAYGNSGGTDLNEIDLLPLFDLVCDI